MRYSLTFPEHCYEELLAHVRAKPAIEQGAFAICGLAVGENESRLLVREVIPVADDHILSQSAVHMSIASPAYVQAMNRAVALRGCLLFIHSHPDGVPNHSPQDDHEERPFFASVYNRVRTTGAVHGSVVMIDDAFTSARVWLDNGEVQPIERVRVVGTRARFWFFDSAADAQQPFFDRQVRAFGPDIQKLLSRLCVGVIGAGGTGSSVIEQLIRLGVGKLVIADGDRFSSTNVNRVYGSRLIDEGIPKVKLAERVAADIGVGTEIEIVDKPVSFRSAMQAFRQCDVMFGCTDDQYGRSIITRFVSFYLMPTIDMGIHVDAEDGTIRSVQGRVTLLTPGAACLHCRRRLDSKTIADEAMRAVDPERAAALEKEGYVAGLQDPAPAVVGFTTTVAASSIVEFLQMLSGFKGSDYQSTEILHLIDRTSLRPNRVAPEPECLCGDPQRWGRGDVGPFLDSTWRRE